MIGMKTYAIYHDESDDRISEPTFKVDQMIEPTISILNKKGYKTIACCSGHTSDTPYSDVILKSTECYIAFDGTFYIEPPKGFSVDYNSNMTIIRKQLVPRDYEYDNDEMYVPLEEIVPKIFEANLELFNWALKLPNKNNNSENNHKITEIVTDEYYSNNWNRMSCSRKLSEDFIRRFKNKVNWHFISVYQTLSEDFIREFKDEVNWYAISRFQKLSEDFIREFQDKVDWNEIIDNQFLSESFMEEFNII